MENITGLFNRLGVARVAAMGVVTVLMIGFFAFLMLRISTPQMAPLYNGLTFEDSSAIVTELRTLNIPFELRGEGSTILVPQDLVTTTRMSLAETGLPTGGQIGYEIFDQQSALGATSFVQNINQVRALEGELARTISSLARVKTARVHLVLPERELFRQERQQPSASIMLNVRGSLNAGEIRAVQQLVASAIEGLTTNRVSIIDSSGRLLASGGGDDDELMAGEMEERTLALETRLRNRIEELLDNIVGGGRARVQVSAELDLNRLTKTSETFDPDGQVVRSAQTRETENQSNLSDGTEGVTVGVELPNAGNAAGAQGRNIENANTTEETINYEISRTTQTEVNEAGGIKRLSVAVVVDGVYAQGADGTASYAPRSEEELLQLTALVRSAIGFDENRGDSVEVVNLQFAERPLAAGLGTSEPGLFDFTKDDLMNFANMAVTLVIGLALLLFVLRPLLKRVLEPEAQPLELAPTAQVDENGVLIETSDKQEEKELDPGAAMVESAKQLGEAQMKTIKTVGALVEENPSQSALIVRDWLGQAA